MAYEFITLERTDSVSVLTLNRPEANNALSRALSLELIDALTTADASKRRLSLSLQAQERPSVPG